MNGQTHTDRTRLQKFFLLQHRNHIFLFLILPLLLLLAGAATAANLRVLGVQKDGTISRLDKYRWLIEEDTTYHVTPGAQVSDTLAVRFHASYMPVVAEGDNNVALPDLDPAKSYYVSVIPKTPGTFSIGGAQLVGNGLMTVYVNELPLPTAQITIFVYQDMNPINNTFDTTEAGLGGFRIKLEDAGGRYGASAGEQSADVYGNILGTTYLMTCDEFGAAPGSGTFGCLDADGAAIVAVDGVGDPIVEPLLTAADGSLTISNLAPGKYGVIVIPPKALEDPPGSGNFVSSNWVQTSTIEGTKVIDAWVKANEPPFFQEFGAPGAHVSVGFVPAGRNKPFVDATVLTGTASISGQIVNLHLSRPPATAFHNGAPFAHTTPWVGLNLGAAGVGRGVYAARANADGSFEIPNVPDGSYQLVVWDDNLDLIFAFHTVTITADTSVAIGEVPVFQWFARTEHWVYNDSNANGVRDAGEKGLVEQAVTLRWRDGSVYQSFPTDSEGFAPFDQVFPFFSWLVAEVDFARFKATGLTLTIDDGGPIDAADPWSWDGVLTPQPQGNPADPVSDTVTNKNRTELGPVLTQGFQAFLGQTHVFQWGKAPYGPEDNGGISGIVFYGVTRAEDYPELAAAEPWEPGIPRVVVNLYAYDSVNKVKGALLNSTVTDSWDDSPPTDCQYGSNSGPFVLRGVPTDCYDGLRNWNQVRPGVFDGGYAFDSIFDAQMNEISPIPPGRYIVEVVPPQGYKVIQSQDKNVDFGDNYVPSPQLLPPECAGTPYVVPDELTLFPDVAANLAGQTLAGCEAKLVSLSNGANAAADFTLFTYTPIAGHITGFILDDTANEYDPASPQFGEKFAPPWLPVAIRDWTGRMISSTYSDEFGTYNALVPSTYTNSLPQPSGMSPNMLTTCMNDPEGDTIGGFYNKQYSTFCYTFQYMPGTTTYLDTPVVPVSAFAGQDEYLLDCEFPDGTPRINVVTSSAALGPYLTTAGGTLTLNAIGTVNVPNPAYDGVGGIEPQTILRDYGFGAVEGTVTLGGIPNLLVINSWTDAAITVTVPGIVADTVSTEQLVVTRGDNATSSITGITVQLGLRFRATLRTVSAGESIQAAIDAARPNDLILVGSGIYDEMLIMWKPVQLQGSGEGTIISALKTPAEKLLAWQQKVVEVSPFYDLVEGQGTVLGGIQPGDLFSEEGAGVLVLATNNAASFYSYLNARNQDARIDGFTITEAVFGGGLVVNGFTDSLNISNNRILGNNGFFGGGVRVGHPELTHTDGEGDAIFSDASNDNVDIINNYIGTNAGFSGAGGGVSICNGSDNYLLSGNFICGNFTQQDGAGIAHRGLSNNGEISDNTVIFNENFNQGITINGGGITISGNPPFGCPIDPGTGQADPACLADIKQSLTPGSGSVQILRNLIQGNSSGVGDGGGIRLSRINGQDVALNPADDTPWYKIDIVNNMIFNNVAGLAGGGISIQDSLRTRILYNNIANNDNTSTGSEAFAPGTPSESNPQPGAAIVSRVHTIELAANLPVTEELFSNPEITNNILWNNRQFFFLVDSTDPTNVLTGLCPDIAGAVGLACAGGNAPVYNDLAVLPTGSGTLTSTNDILTGDVFLGFVTEYTNGSRSSINLPENTTGIGAPPAFDEGGNFIRLRYGPLSQTDPVSGTLLGNLHLNASNNGGAVIGDVTDDFDGDTRDLATPDIGADEL